MVRPRVAGFSLSDSEGLLNSTVAFGCCSEESFALQIIAQSLGSDLNKVPVSNRNPAALSTSLSKDAEVGEIIVTYAAAAATMLWREIRQSLQSYVYSILVSYGIGALTHYKQRKHRSSRKHTAQLIRESMAMYQFSKNL